MNVNGIRLSLLFILSIFAVHAYSHTLTIKFKSGSEIYERWYLQHRSGEVSELTSIIGKHATSPYISDKVLTLLKTRKAGSLQKVQSINEESLQRIANVIVDSSLITELILKKISSLPYIEYAELKSSPKFIEIPNDPYYNYQSYLTMIEAEKAWDYYNASSVKDSIIIAIVDTGVDPLHEDLQEALFQNVGESGIDSLGKEKKSNGIDDDNNGFVDDWNGWDFASTADPVNGDNRPYPGHTHGTHVAGIAAALSNNQKGISGIARNMKILPVKVGIDDTNSVSVTGGYESILYAAAMGADIINCSWGSPSGSKAEEEVINQALLLGSVIVGGAGNDGMETAFYPASYPGVISVAAISGENYKTSYSNYNASVDIACPGSFVYSTILANRYDYMSGTSMAAPIVAGTIGLLKSLHPDYSPEMLAAIIKSTAISIDSTNPNYIGLLGAGKLNAYAAVSVQKPQYITLTQKEFVDANSDGMFSPGEKLQLKLSAKNVLDVVDSVIIIARVDTSQIKLAFQQDSIHAGNFDAGTLYSLSETIQCTLPNNPPYNYRLKIFLDIYSGPKKLSSEIAELTINPTYRTLRENSIGITLNSLGNIGYNDYPSNAQGIGFTIDKDVNSVLFEGGLIIANSASRLSSSVRDISGNRQEESFSITNPISLSIPGILAIAETQTAFTDLQRDYDAGSSVKQTAYQFKEDSVKGSVFLVYDVVNQNTIAMDSLFVGLFMDWDIGPAGQDNICGFNQNEGYALAFNSYDPAYPQTGIALLTNQKLNYYAIDNDGVGESFSIYDGFSRNEKWYAISGGISRPFTRSTDASMVIGAGPITLQAGSTERIAFVLSAAHTADELTNEIQRARLFSASRNIGSGFTWKKNPTNSQLIDVGISVGEHISVEYQLKEQALVEFEVYSILGNRMLSLPAFLQSAGEFMYQDISFSGLPSGVYFLKMFAGGKVDALPFVITR